MDELDFGVPTPPIFSKVDDDNRLPLSEVGGGAAGNFDYFGQLPVNGDIAERFLDLETCDQNPLSHAFSNLEPLVSFLGVSVEFSPY